MDLAYNEAARLLYVAVQGTSSCEDAIGAVGVEIWDVTDILHPLLLSVLEIPFFGQCVNPTGIAIQGDYAYVTGLFGLYVFDVAEPHSPQFVRMENIPSPSDLIVSGDVAFVRQGSRHVLHVVDISDPVWADVIGQIDLPVTWATSGTDTFAVSGNHLFALGTEEGLVILDISDPTAPVEVGRCSDVADPGAAYGLSLDGARAVVLADRKLHVVDISIPEAPVLAYSGDYDLLIGGAGSVSLAATPNFAFILDPTPSLPKLSVADISNLTSAVRETARYWTHGEITGVAVQGTYAYLARLGYYGMEIVDISDPAHPELQARVGFKGKDVVVRNGFACLADERGFHIYDITNPNTVRKLGTWSEEAGGVIDLSISGDRVYVLRSDSVRIIDISNRALPILLGSIEGTGLTRVFAVGDTIYLSSETGVHAVDVSNAETPRGLGTHLAGPSYGVFIAGAYAYVAAETELVVLDKSDPTEMLRVGSFSWECFDVSLASQYAITTRLSAFDVSDPSAPTQITYYKSFARGPACRVALEAGHVFVTDPSQGLHIFEAPVDGPSNLLPTASAGQAQTVQDVDGSDHELVTLDATDSYDLDGFITSWIWNEEGHEIARGETAIATFTLGTHTVTVIVTDNEGATDTDTVEIAILAAGVHTVSKPDAPDVPSTGTAGESLGFTPGGATCSHGHAIEYTVNWGDGSLSGWDAGGPLTHTFSTADTYQITAQARCAPNPTFVSDLSDTSAVIISMPNVDPPGDADQPPIARASDIDAASLDLHPYSEFTVSTKFFDPNGRENLRYCYLRLDHPSKPLTLMWYESDDHVTGWSGQEGEDYLSQVYASAVEIADSSGREGYQVAWTFQIQEAWPQAESAIRLGVYAEDDGGLASGWNYGDLYASFWALETGGGNRPPVALIRHYPSDNWWLLRGIYLLVLHSPYYDREQEVTFDAAWSFDPDGSIASYRWDFGDGYGASGKVVTHRYNEKGTFEVRLVVSDDDGVTNEFTEVVIIAIPSESDIAMLRFAASHLLDSSSGLVGTSVPMAAQDSADAANEFAHMLTEDAIDAILSVLAKLIPIGDLVAKSTLWSYVALEAGITGLQQLARGDLADIVAYLALENEPYSDALALVQQAASAAEADMNSSYSGALDGIEKLEAADVRALSRDLRQRVVGNQMMASMYAAMSDSLHECAMIAREDRDHWQTKLAEVFWEVGIACGVAAIGQAAGLAPILGKAAGWAATSAEVLDSFKSMGANNRLWFQSHSTLSQAAFEDSDRFPQNVMAAIQSNTTKGFEHIRNQELPKTVEGSINAIEAEDTASVRILIENTGKNAGWYRVILHTEQRFTSFELFKGLGYYWIVPYSALFPDDERGWFVIPGQSRTVEIEIPKHAQRVNIYLLGENDSGIYGLDSMFMIYRDRDSFVDRFFYKLEVNWGSPIEVVVQDPEGKVTGVVDGSLVEEIDGSACSPNEETIWIISSNPSPSAFDDFTVVINGIKDGSYTLEVSQSGAAGIDVFNAYDISISSSMIHEYSFDWEALAIGYPGASVSIDSNDDGVVDAVIVSGPNLVDEDVPEIVPIPPQEPSLPEDAGLRLGPNPVEETGAVFFLELPADVFNARLRIFNVTGRLVFDVPLDPSSLRFPATGRWDPVDQDGIPLANGPYICVLIADGQIVARTKMVIQR
ncbi:PKD domain-containing protein [Candidatus Bipolaricaulota bacterium]